MLKNVTMTANFPPAATRQRYCGPEENQCVSTVAQHDPKDYHFEANMKIQYAYRDCVKANATQIYHTLYYKRYHHHDNHMICDMRYVTVCTCISYIV